MTEEQKDKLGKALWDIANELRGAMNADDFRDYMLSFLFLKYISDYYQDNAKKELQPDYPQQNDDKTSLQLWYEQNPNDTDSFENLMRRNIHYTIKPDYLWDNITLMAQKHDNELLNTLRTAFKHIENESFERAFQGLFSEINLESDKLGKNYEKRNENLCHIIAKIAKGLKENNSDNDNLGDAYEYLIGEFAADAGKKAGEFYTPQSVSTILSHIITLDSQDPTQGIKNKMDSIFDFACGSGSLLLNVKNIMKNHHGTIGKIYGQEKNITTYNLARMNMLLHGVKDTEFEIYHGDTLENDWDMLLERNPNKKASFDAIVANPPFSLSWKHSDELKNDVRFKEYGIAPKSAADFAFLLHGLHYLKDNGTMAIILPHGVLFRGGSEDAIRKKLLKDDNIDAVIGLPANLFYSTGIPVCILVIKKCKKHDDVLFINAAQEFEKGKRQNKLLPQHINKIIETYQNRIEAERYSKRISMENIEAQDYNLNISRYISTEEPEKEIDLKQVYENIISIDKKIEDATQTHNKFWG